MRPASSTHGIREQMIALQEELDWTVYRSTTCSPRPSAKALIADDMGRAAESARRAGVRDRPRAQDGGRRGRDGLVRAARLHADHRAPRALARGYRAVVQARIDIIETPADIALIERPECKRRWATQTVGEEGSGGAARLAAGPLRAAGVVVRPARRARRSRAR